MMKASGIIPKTSGVLLPIAFLLRDIGRRRPVRRLFPARIFLTLALSCTNAEFRICRLEVADLRIGRPLCRNVGIAGFAIFWSAIANANLSNRAPRSDESIYILYFTLLYSPLLCVMPCRNYAITILADYCAESQYFTMLGFALFFVYLFVLYAVFLLFSVFVDVFYFYFEF